MVIVSVMINEIVDDELLLVNAIVNDKNLDDVDNEEEEIVQFETALKRKLNMWMLLKHLQLLNHTWLKII